MSLTKKQDELFEWYLAYLRKSAQKHVKTADMMTPMTLIHADQELLRQLVREEAESRSRHAPASDLEAESKKKNYDSMIIGAGLLLIVLLALILQQLTLGLMQLAVAILLFVFLMKRAKRKLELSAQLASKLRLVMKADADKASIETESSNLASASNSSGSTNVLDDPEQIISSLLDNLQLMEQKERLIFEYCSMILCQLNHDARVMRLNENAESIWGYGKADLAGLDVSKLIAAGGKGIFAEKLESCKDKLEPAEFEIRLHKKNNEMIDLLWRMEWSEKSNAYFCFAEDISASKNAERLKDEMTSTINHDLRAPISGLNFALQNMLLGSYGDISEDISTALQRSMRNIKSVLSLLDNLLDVQKLESGNMKSSKSELRVQDCFNQAAELVHEWCKAAGVDLQIEDTDCRVQADLDQVCRILCNLLANAIKWTPSGSQIIVRAKGQVEFVVIEVEDGGPGVPEELKSTLFQRWGTGAAAVKNFSPSVGLGLYIAKKLTELQSGAIGVKSGKSGAIFWFSLLKV